MNDPRIPSLKGIMQSKKKPIESVELASLGLSDEDLSPDTAVLSYENMPEREPGKKYEGEPEEVAREVAQLLDTEENVL
jgi:Electron transfer flavoprotein, beta subunit